MATIIYNVTALQMTIYFNKEGDHDHNGLLFALTDNIPTLKYIDAMANGDTTPPSTGVIARASWLEVPLPTSTAEAKQPHPLIRPLVLRCNQGDTVKVVLKNEVRNRWVGLHLVSEGYDVKKNDGSDVGYNQHSLVQYNDTRTFTWSTEYEGVFTFHDGGNYSGGEDGTNVHGLFGALVVEPPGTIWRDPKSGRTSLEGELDGLYLDVIPAGVVLPSEITSSTTLPTHVWDAPKPYFNFKDESYREFVIFFHDEPEFVPPHGSLVKDPCLSGHGEHNNLPIMPISYRAEPMVNREQKLFKLMKDGHVFDKPVLNEEQHHSSWMFGDPVTPILKAYIGDPVRIRFVHAGVKETHVFHLHLYEWHAVPEDRNSPRIDAISVSPQTAHTIEPVWGAGNRHQVAADIIWHCHLYPHFHEGMWGIFRTFETLQRGVVGDSVAAAPGEEGWYLNRTIGQYPDGTTIEKLLPLPDRAAPPNPTATHPGYPLYIPGKVKQKSPIPPWPDRALTGDEAQFCDFDSLLAADMPPDFDYRAVPTSLERNAFNQMPLPGELFTRNPLRPQQQMQWSAHPAFERNGSREVCHDVVMAKQKIEYNGYGWHDKDGHLYYLKAEGDPDARTGPKEPLFFRALHGQIVNLTFENQTPPDIAETEFDLAFPPCAARPWLGECAMHVHMVKFDPVCADGAATGWNYISGPVSGKKMVYRWWLDQEFGTIFFHDHLFANYRQKHGLFGALLVEPIGSKFYHNITNQSIVSGLQAVIERHTLDTATPRRFREFCIGIADFIPMWKPDGEDGANTIALNPPDHPGGHGDKGVMALNYRCDPIHERLKELGGTTMIDPALWFSSGAPYNRDPYTTLFLTYESDAIWFRIVQGSHEEQHSFQVHGLRWQRFREQVDSALRNQQAFGLSEAFTFIHQEAYGKGDYMYKLSAADDMWLGCWGIIRSFSRGVLPGDVKEPLPIDIGAPDTPPLASMPAVSQMRRFHIVVEAKRLVYREPDLVDPFGLIYRLVSYTSPGGITQIVPVPARPEPLVIRCREGEWVQVTLENRLPDWYHPEPEPFAPEVPVEERDHFTHQAERRVSTRVSMHADLVLYNVDTSDGATVGKNSLQSVDKGGSITYTWNTYRPPGTNAGEPLGAVLLQDMADFRNHRHHGLIGALIIEERNATPYKVLPGATTATGWVEAWYGVRATVLIPGIFGTRARRIEEAVLLLQDGLRLYLRGHIHSPIADEPPGHGEDQLDKEDQGQKAFNYRSEPVGPNVDPNYDPENAASIPPADWFTGDWLSKPNPATPVITVAVNSRVQLHLVGGGDKPRQRSFTVHGVAWPEWHFMSTVRSQLVSSESAITTGTVRKFKFTPKFRGDHAYRSGVLKWDVPQGLWGILRVKSKKSTSGCIRSILLLTLLLTGLALRKKRKTRK